MAEVEPMKIDGSDERKPKVDVPDQKKTLKRKRLDPISYTGNPEEKQAKINTFRNEINNLVKFCKDLSSENRGALLENAEKVECSSATLNCVIACLMEESDLPFSKLVDEIYEKVKGRMGNGESITRVSVKSTVLMIGQRLCFGVTNADADPLEDDSDCALWCWEVYYNKLITFVFASIYSNLLYSFHVSLFMLVCVVLASRLNCIVFCFSFKLSIYWLY